MKILHINNTYHQRGGEDISADKSAQLLREAGHEVIEYTRSNSAAFEQSLLEKLYLPIQMMWATDTLSDLRAIARQHQPDIAHFHNTHFMISPSAYYACREMGIPVVQTLKNYRLICPAATFFRDGHVCEDCMGKPIPWPGVLHGCYRNSRLQTGVVAATLTLHHLLHTWQDMIAEFITMTHFGRAKFLEAGVINAPISVIPHHHTDPGLHPPKTARGDFMLFVGRLAREKGVATLLRAFEQMPDVPLKIAGDGPMLPEIQAYIQTHHLGNVEVLGPCTTEQVQRLMHQAHGLVFTSEWYETFGLVIIEAFASSLAVIASCMGTATELVRESETGLLFDPGNAGDLAQKVRWAWEHPVEFNGMGQTARQEYEQKYTAETHYKALIEVYQRVISRRTPP